MTGEGSNTLAGSRREAAPRAGLRLRQQVQRLLQRDVQRRKAAGQGAGFLAALHIGAKFAVVGHDRLARLRMPAERARQRQQLQRRLKIDVLRVHAPQQRGVLRLFLAVGRAALDVGPEAADLDEHRLARLGTDAQRLLGLAGLVEHFQRRRKGQFVGRQAVGQACPAVALLQERPVAADADEDLRRGVAFAGRSAQRDAADVRGRRSRDCLFSSNCFSPRCSLPK